MSPNRLPTVFSLCLALSLVSASISLAPANASPLPARPLQADAIAQASAPAAASSSAPPDAAAPAGSTHFIENAGQWQDAARFQVRGGGQTLWLANDAIWLTFLDSRREASPEDLAADQTPGSDEPFVRQQELRGMSRPHSPAGVNIRLSFPDASPDVRIEPFDPLTTTVSYFLGNDPGKWRPHVPVYSGVRYVDLYPRVDLVLGGADATWQLEVQPGAKTSAVRLRIEGADGALLDGDKLRLTTAAGDLDLALPAASVALQVEVVSAKGPPTIFDLQPTSLHAVRRTVLQTPGDDPSDLIYSTYLGGSSWDQVNALAVDTAGQATIAGITKLSAFPTTPGAYDPSYNGGDHDAFIARLSADGSTLIYSTFLGGSGSGSDWPDDIALNGAGQATVSGNTPSSDFPTTPGAYDTTHGGGSQPFVTRLNADGSALIFSTFFDGPIDAIAVNHAGQTIMAGVAGSSSFPTTAGAYDRAFGGGTCGTPPSTYPCPDAFVARLSADGRTLAYSTFLGGSGSDSASAVAVDSTDRISVAGSTSSGDFPTTPGAHDRTYHGGAICGTPPARSYLCPDVFVARLSADGNMLVYGTFLGGSQSDSPTDIAADTAGQVTVTGNTASDDFPTSAGAFDPSFNGSGSIGWASWDDAFVARFSASGRLVYSTYLGGTRGDESNAVAVDSADRATVTGLTNSSDFPTTPGAFDISHSGSSYDLDAFVARLSADGQALSYGTFLGGRQSDRGYALALDSQGRAIAAGMTASDEFPTTPGAFNPWYPYGIAGFVSKLDMYAPNVLAPIEQPGPAAIIAGTVTLSGFAVDLNSQAGTGVDGVDIYLDGASGTGTLIGHATYGVNRPDVAARFGARFGPSGWELAWDTTGLALGTHTLHLYAHLTTNDTWSELPPRLVIVPRGQLVWLPLIAKDR